MKDRRIALWLSILIGLSLVGNPAMISAASPDQPYRLIIDAISRGDVDRAFHWINVTMKDFPHSKEAKLAQWLRIPLFVATILSRVQVHIAYTKGARYGLDTADFYAKLSASTACLYVGTLREALEAEVIPGIPGFLQEYRHDKLYDFGLKPLDDSETQFDAVKHDLELVSMGIQPDKSISDLAAVAREMYLPSTVGLFMALETTEPEPRAMLFITLAHALQLGTSLESQDGVRLLTGEKRTLTIHAAQKCVDLALELTEDNPYSDTRADAEELKAKLEGLGK